ncbi:hypothetical protein [Terrabacter carboxydivorans]|uniref:Uncharacterized protein n=1 Tax=Terrabacter carboxydivorans TaxID=619730 RepID=A0ABP5YKD2_9MICO
MKWLLMVVAFVLGASITWFLTVKRVSRTVTADGAAAPVVPEAEVAPVVSPGGPVAGAVGVAGGADLVAATNPGVLATAAAASSDDGDDEGDDVPEDDASRFGGVHTPASESPGVAEGWDRDAEDEDALVRHASDDTSGDDAQPVDAESRHGADEEATPGLPPVEGASPKGDMAGVGDPTEVAALEDASPDATPKPD